MDGWMRTSVLGRTLSKVKLVSSNNRSYTLSEHTAVPRTVIFSTLYLFTLLIPPKLKVKADFEIASFQLLGFERAGAFSENQSPGGNPPGHNIGFVSDGLLTSTWWESARTQ